MHIGPSQPKIKSPNPKISGRKGNNLNDITLFCRSLKESVNFYQALGFAPIGNPDGLLGFNTRIHFQTADAEDQESLTKKDKLNPKDSHISFECESIDEVEIKLKEMRIEYNRAKVKERGMYVDQLSFHDLDGFSIKIRKRDKLTMVS